MFNEIYAKILSDYAVSVISYRLQYMNTGNYVKMLRASIQFFPIILTFAAPLMFPTRADVDLWRAQIPHRARPHEHTIR